VFGNARRKLYEPRRIKVVLGFMGIKSREAPDQCAYKAQVQGQTLIKKVNPLQGPRVYKASDLQGSLDYHHQHKSSLTKSFHLKVVSSQQGASSSGKPLWGEHSISQPKDAEKTTVPYEDLIWQRPSVWKWQEEA
jgi:hypothetical protein